MSLTGLRDGEITPNDHGPVVNIIAWFLMVTMILSVITRLMIRTLLAGSLGVDDGIISVCLLLGIGQVIAVSYGVKNGLGRRMHHLNMEKLDNMDRAIYASDLLYILTLCFAKLSVLYLLKRLTTKTKHRYYIWGLLGLIVSWACAAFLSIAFQCGPRQPWREERHGCISPTAFWEAIGSFDILSELLIMLQPIWLTWNLHMSRWNKIVVASAFLLRISVPITIIPRLVFLRKALSGPDRAFDLVAVIICTQCEICSSIVTACIPVTKPFLDAFASGMLGNSLRQRIPRNAQTESYSLQDVQSAPQTLQDTMTRALNGSIRTPTLQMGSTAAASAQAIRNPHTPPTKRRSISSVRSDQMIIKRTDQWLVQYQDKAKLSNDTIDGPSQVSRSAV